MRRRAPRLILIAFALSLVVHLIVALILHPPVPTPENQAEVVSIEHRPATIAVKPVPTIPPPPKRTPAPRVVTSARPAVNGTGAAANAGGGAKAPTPAPPTPQAATTSKAECAKTDIAAAVVATPGPPDIASDVRASATNGTALVSVQLDPDGNVTGTSVTQSTGNSSLDLVALGMARDTRYSPALRDCKPIASAYSFSVKFVAW
jgi:periplasmic protein TonB